MAKKVVATLAKGDIGRLAKLIQAKKSPKTGAYVFRSRIIPRGMVKEVLNKES